MNLVHFTSNSEARILALVSLVALGVCFPIHAQETALAFPLQISGKERLVAEIGGREPGGWRFVASSEQDSAALADIISDSQLVKFGRPAALRNVSLVRLRDGSRIAAESVVKNAQEIMVRSPSLGEVPLDVACVKSVAWAPLDAVSGEAPSNDSLLSPAAGEELDALYLLDGQALHGKVLAADDDSLRIRVLGEESQISVALLASWVLSGQVSPRLEKNLPDATWVGCTDGSLLKVQRCGAGKEQHVSLTLLCGQQCSLSTAQICFVQTMSPACIYLSDVPAEEHRQFPLLGEPWSLKADRDATGDLLYVRGELFLKGIGVHAPNRAVYKRPQGYAKLRGEIGMTDAEAEQGSVEFLVYLSSSEDFRSQADWRLAYKSGWVRRGDPAKVLEVPLNDAKWIALVTSEADNADILDRCAWLDIRFEP